jgi:hypothetical protein
LPASLNWNVPVVTDEAFKDSLKLATTVVPVPTPVAPFNGVTEITVGGVTSDAAVVNDHT